MPLEPSRSVSIVIPTWRRADLLRTCLESLRQQTNQDFETLLVSNGAGNWVDSLAGEFQCALLKFPENRGFAAAVNAGIAQAAGRYVAVLNDDVQLSPNWLETTTGFLGSHPDVSFCCGKIYRANSTALDNAGDALSLGGSAWRLGYGRNHAPEYDGPRPLPFASATATLYRRSAFDAVGLFDENFFAYLEDVDFSLRSARAGLLGFYLPQAVSYHWGGASHGGPQSALAFRLVTRNQLLLIAKHYPWSLLLRLAPRIAWAQLLWLLLAVRKGRLRAYLSGMASFLRLLPRAARARAELPRDGTQRLMALLATSERAIYADVTAPDRSEQDTFWKLYFRVFPIPARESSRHADLNRLPAR